MIPIALLFLIVNSVALFVLPRRWASVPLLAGACYMTLGQGYEIAGLNFYLIRLLLLAGWMRVVIRQEWPKGLMLGMDWAFVAWAIWAILASVFHEKPVETFENRLGMVYNGLSIYFLMRCFCQTEEDIRKKLCMIAWLLVPVALAMLYEYISHFNLFSLLGGVPAESLIRDGRVRAQGPFAHSILAGTVGAVCIPLMVGIWKYHAFSACVGLIACSGMILTSVSSGPIISAISGLFAIVLWRWRHWTKHMLLAAITGYILLELVMKAPAYYLIARINPTTGYAYHRAAIIEAAITYFKEWWFAGTDYTRHWMPYGVSWSPDHSDITNHYLGQGVKGGLLLMLLFISILWIGFHYVGQILRKWSDKPTELRFLIWALGASLFAHTVSCLSVAYFDQSIVFLYWTMALIAHVRANTSIILPTRLRDAP